MLRALANPVNQSILSLLAIEPSHPRRLSGLLTRSESDVSRRLARMQEAGLVESAWEHTDGKNVKTYRLVADDLRVRIGARGLAIDVGEDGDDAERRTVIDRLRVRIPDPAGFVGRHRELEILDGPDPVVIVEGIAGIGKTSLASAYARAKQDETPVFFHTFSGTETLTWLTHRLGVFHARHGRTRLMDAIEANAPLEDQRELLLEALDDGAHVTVLDAVEQIRDEDLEAALADAIRRVHDGKLVITGRQAPSHDPTARHARRVRLTGLAPEEVHALLGERGLDTTTETAHRLQRRLGGHPLAVHLLAETATEADDPLETVLDRMPDQDTEDYLLDEVSRHLSDAEEGVLAHASIFPGPFTREDLEAITPRDPGGALVKLRRRRLLRDDGETLRMHRLLGSFFHERLEDPASLHEEAAEHALTKGTLEARLDALYHLLEAGNRSRVLAMLERDLDLEEFDLIEDGYHNLYLDVLERFDPQDIRNDHQAGLVLDEKGDIRYHRGEHEQALERYREAAKRFQAADAGHRLADLAWKKALSLKELGRPEQAHEQATRGLEDHEPDERTRDRLSTLADELEA